MQKDVVLIDVNKIIKTNGVETILNVNKIGLQKTQKKEKKPLNYTDKEIWNSTENMLH